MVVSCSLSPLLYPLKPSPTFSWLILKSVCTVTVVTAVMQILDLVSSSHNYLGFSHHHLGYISDFVLIKRLSLFLSFFLYIFFSYFIWPSSSRLFYLFIYTCIIYVYYFIYYINSFWFLSVCLLIFVQYSSGVWSLVSLGSHLQLAGKHFPSTLTLIRRRQIQNLLFNHGF